MATRGIICQRLMIRQPPTRRSTGQLASLQCSAVIVRSPRAAFAAFAAFAVCATLAGCGDGNSSNLATSKRDGYSFAVNNGPSVPAGDPGPGADASAQQACSIMAGFDKPSGDDPGSWEEGCQAGLKSWRTMQAQNSIPTISVPPGQLPPGLVPTISVPPGHLPLPPGFVPTTDR